VQLSIVIPTLGLVAEHVHPMNLDFWKRRGARLAHLIPHSFPFIGPRVWGSADAVYRQALAEPFWRPGVRKLTPRLRGSAQGRIGVYFPGR
jgi:hypothetical protein